VNEGPVTGVVEHRPRKVELCRVIDTSSWITRDGDSDTEKLLSRLNLVLAEMLSGSD
jgi:hypothetical protein